MKTIAIAILSACVASACASAPPAGEEASNVRDVAFSCANGEQLSVLFHTDTGVATLQRNGESIELQQQPSGSGFIYSNGPNTIRGKGNDLTVEIGRMVPIQCTAK
ncbi:MAG: MliC family protein [Thermomonas sp.]